MTSLSLEAQLKWTRLAHLDETDRDKLYSNNSESSCGYKYSHQVSVQSNIMVLKEMSFVEFQDGRHGGHV